MSVIAARYDKVARTGSSREKNPADLVVLLSI